MRRHSSTQRVLAWIISSLLISVGIPWSAPVCAERKMFSGKKFALYRGGLDRSENLAEIEIYVQRSFEENGAAIVPQQTVVILSGLPMNTELFSCSSESCLTSISKSLSSDYVLIERADGEKFSLVLYDRGRDRNAALTFSRTALSKIHPKLEANKLVRKLYPSLVSEPIVAGAKPSIEAGSAAIAFVSNLDIADVMVDGKKFEAHSLAKKIGGLPAGPAIVEVRAEGYQSYKKEVMLTSSQTRVVEFYLQEQTPVAVVQTKLPQPTPNMPSPVKGEKPPELLTENFDRAMSASFESSDDPLTKKWWFWTLVASAAGGIAYGMSQVLDQEVASSGAIPKKQTRFVFKGLD